MWRWWGVVCAGMLSACDCDPATEICVGEDTEVPINPRDEDQDGYEDGAGDCDDHHPGTHPGAPELCDGEDNDCDETTIDDGRATLFPYRGRAIDVTAELGVGTEQVPASWTLSRPGLLALCTGIWYARVEVTAAQAEIVGRGGEVVLDARGAGTVIDASAPLVVPAAKHWLKVRHLTLTGGNGEEGGGLAVSGRDLTLQDVVLRDNVASVAGGGVLVRGGAFTMSGGSLLGNTAGKGGGAWVEATEDGVSLSGVEISGNEASVAGAGLHLEVKTWALSTVTLSENRSAGPGGAVVALGSGAGAVSADCTITDNIATGGAGLYVDGGTLTLNAAVSNNTARGYGGALAVVDGASVTINGDILDNTANLGGGGLYAVGGQLDVGGITLRGNSSNDGAGGIELGTLGVLEMNGGVIGDNEGGRGAGIASVGGRVTLTATGLQGNRATGRGGGIYFDGEDIPGGEVALSLTGVTLTSNTATEEGGGAYVEGASVEIFEGDFSQNEADGGAGLWLQDAVVDIRDAHIGNNTAEVDGGGIAASGGTLTVTDTDLGVNAASTGDGGGLWLSGCTATLIDASITEGSAMSGAGVYQLAGQMTWSGGSLLDNDSRLDGGGLAISQGTACFDLALVQRNSAGGQGGGAKVGTGASVQFVASTFSSNAPDDVWAGSSVMGADGAFVCTPAGCQISTATECPTP